MSLLLTNKANTTCDEDTSATEEGRSLFATDKSSYGTAITTKEAREKDEREQEPLLATVSNPYNFGGQHKASGKELSNLWHALFYEAHHDYSSSRYTKKCPVLPPEKRKKRHRNFYIFQLNRFRHWWKTSRLLVRLSGGLTYCEDAVAWSTMRKWDVSRRKQAKKALKQVKLIGRGGPVKLFLEQVHVFTRSLRIVLAVARAWEAKVDNRLCEVGLAEGFAFIGNRCFRYWARHITDWLTAHVMFPISATFLAPYIDANSRPVIVLMGFLRAIAPFAASFQGSRFGRQLIFNTYKYANYRWKSVQSIMKFHERAGTYQDTNLDPELLDMARKVAMAIGHGSDPVETQSKLLSMLGWGIFGAGSGGYAVYRIKQTEQQQTTVSFLLHVTPYGPSLLDEMPRYIRLERYGQHAADMTDTGSADDIATSTILQAAVPPQAKVEGYTYSGAFFQAQEWAALKQRYDQQLADYDAACRIMGTRRLPANKRNPQHCKSASPPTDLASLKTFIRSGHDYWKQRRDNQRWKQIQSQVQQIAKLVAKYQKQLVAPKRIILYLEGLDCAGKSSTGGLICQALGRCGYDVTVAQHNRPPSAEQRTKPWMDRGRFEYPDDMYKDTALPPEYASVLWDRGPAGDFVYGNLAEFPLKQKLERYHEFRAYNIQCRENGVLFCKVFFVADKDSIASTLGKRLAHKKIARDLQTWLNANSSLHCGGQGLEEIESHIDPTDFVAFNKYEQNLANFAEVVRNTDQVGHEDLAEESSGMLGYYNPWLVVNTSDRHRARLGIMKAFRRQLHRFAADGTTGRVAPNNLWTKLLLWLFFWRPQRQQQNQKDSYLRKSVATLTRPVPSNIVEEREHGISPGAVFQTFILICLAYAYAHQTWDFDIAYVT